METRANIKSTWGLPPSEDASEAVLFPHKRLAGGVMLKACQDAQEGVLDAILFLGSYAADLFCEVLGFENDQNLRLLADILLDKSIKIEHEAEATEADD
jgi:hypothetical protein